MRRGFTLAEVLIAVVLSLIVLSAGFLVWNLAQRSRGITGVAEALQCAMIIEERIEHDLRKLMIIRACPVRFYPDNPARLAFYIADPQEVRQRDVGLKGVAYALAPGGYLTRTCDGRSENVGTQPLESLAFVPYLSPTGPLVRVSLTIRRPAGEPGGPLVHTFLARMSAPRRLPDLPWKVTSDFSDPQDAPGGQELDTP